MSQHMRPVSTLVTLCDLCGKEIPEPREAFMSGSVTAGYIAHPVTPQTKRAWLTWPPVNAPWFTSKHPELAEIKTRRYDFHAECIVSLVETNLFDHAGGDEQ